MLEWKKLKTLNVGISLCKHILLMRPEVTTLHIRCVCSLLILILIILRCSDKDGLYTSVEYRNRKSGVITSTNSIRKAFSC